MVKSMREDYGRIATYCFCKQKDKGQTCDIDTRINDLIQFSMMYFQDYHNNDQTIKMIDVTRIMSAQYIYYRRHGLENIINGV